MKRNRIKEDPLELNTVIKPIEEAIEKLNTMVNSFSLTDITTNNDDRIIRLNPGDFKESCRQISNKLEDLIPVIRKLLEDKTDLITELVNKAIDFDTKKVKNFKQ